MNHGNSIFRAFRTLVKDIVNNESFFIVDEEDPMTIFFKNRELQLILRHMNGFIATFNYKTGFYEYISEGLTANLGYKMEDMIGEKGVNFVYEIMHPQHAKAFIEVIMTNVLKYLSEHADYATGRDYRFNCCMQIRDIHQVYKWFLLDTVIMETDENGFPARSLITCTNIDPYKKDNLLYYNIMKKDASQIYQVVFEGFANDPMATSVLTSRETEILTLITNGFTNKMISDKLFISETTVKSHRRNIISKTKCKGPVELTNFAFSRGLI